jgi:hypothetical protein
MNIVTLHILIKIVGPEMDVTFILMFFKTITLILPFHVYYIIRIKL